MSDAGLAHWCHEVALALPGATVDQPFGPGAETFRVHGKVFALLTQADAVGPHPIVNVKAEPREVPLLIAEHAFVHPGWHMNKKHWITVELCAATDLELAAELIEDSYDNVVAGLPRHLRSTLRALAPAPRAPGHLPLR
ncbi:MAG: MmcQ/YjbR family DNA-binding protein [Actinomycetales bacterium]|nr:MmcQ/YjbR family DNA-binding protein [Actinomycetales bacterium]